jgi:hypothetical protein
MLDTSEAYAARFADLRHRLVETLGGDTVDLVLERAVREAAQVYPGFRLTGPDGARHLEYEPDTLAEHSDEFVRNAYSALYAAMLIILARILGREIAVRLASAVDAERVLQGQPLGHL